MQAWKATFFILHRQNGKNFSLGSAKGNQKKDVRIDLKSFVAVAVIREEEIVFGFSKLKESTAKMQSYKIAQFLTYLKRA